MNRKLLAVVTILFCIIPMRGFCGLVIPLTEIGNPYNTPHYPTGLGRVTYTYYMSDEIKWEQFNEYWMLTYNGEAYTWFGDEGSDTDPVVLSDPVEAMRFCNWLHNGRGTGDTETGAYDIAGAAPHPDGSIMNGYAYVLRNSDAKWFIPDLNEWVKAFYLDDNSLTQTTQTGLYPRGEWTETVLVGDMYGYSYDYPYYFVANSSASTFTSTNEIRGIYPLTPATPFRVATTIPEPSSSMLIIVGGSIFILLRNKSSLQKSDTLKNFFNAKKNY